MRKVELSIVRGVDGSYPSRKVCSLYEATAWIYITMSDEHQRMIHGEVISYYQWLKSDPLLRRRSIPKLSHLAEIFISFAKQAASSSMRPYDLPSNVAEVYIRDLKASPDHECEDCGYRVPITRINSKEEKLHFPKCPLCNGNTGEGLWKGAKYDLEAPLRVGEELYKIRWKDYFEKFMQILNESNKDIIPED
ncbi:MAG: hypothetical protein M3362_21205, partial [Acidobacteriota bacterium]|nr:hypothetical protein [Acidobacteriota bacterium]